MGRELLCRGVDANGYNWKALRQKEWLVGEPAAAAAAVCPGRRRKSRVLIGWSGYWNYRHDPSWLAMLIP